MREVKFRAWDKQRKEYLSGGQILISVGPGRCPKCNPIYLDILQDADEYKDRFVLEKWTGRRDENGKDCFESDIVITPAGDAVIRFGEYHPPCGGGESHIGFYVDFIKPFDNTVYRKDLGYWLPYARIAGNINENPEMMEASENEKKQD